MYQYKLEFSIIGLFLENFIKKLQKNHFTVNT